MHKVIQECDRTIAVVSPDYLKSRYCAPEWASAYGRDPESIDRKLVTVRVVECEPQGLLEHKVHIDTEESRRAGAPETRSVGSLGCRMRKRSGAPEPQTGEKPSVRRLQGHCACLPDL